MTWLMMSGWCWRPCSRGRRKVGGPAPGRAAAGGRDPLADQVRVPVAEHPAGLQSLAVGLRAVPPLAARRHLGPAGVRAAGPGGCGRARDLGRVGRLVHRAGAPARRRARKDGAGQKEPPGGDGPAEGDDALGRSRDGLTTKFHLAVEQGQMPPNQEATRARTRSCRLHSVKISSSRAHSARSLG